jgi:Cu(I)/Ag(I) efflux system membrane protein CusA/SilA
MAHASIGEALDVIQRLDTAVSAIPEVERTVGKLGRVDSSLDPAPISMFENIINYKTEYALDKNGNALKFRFDDLTNEYVRDTTGELIPDANGKPYRQWRTHIKSPDDIWHEIVAASKIPGTTSAPKLQPIAARIVMLQSGMRAPMGVKVRGPSLEAINIAGLQIESLLKEIPSIETDTVVADRVVGKPYLEIDIDRQSIARYGLSIKDVQDVLEVAVGGKPLTMTLEGRERYPVRIRYQRELRNGLETLGSILIPTPQGQHIPLRELSDINFEQQAQVIKSEDTFLTSYVVFDKKEGLAEVDVVDEASSYLKEKIKSGELKLPAGVNYVFAGSYENQLRAKKRLAIVIPLTLFSIFIILYMQFRSTAVTLIIFAGVFVAWSGGFIMLWLYSQDWFLNFSALGLDFRQLFQVRQFNLSVAVWVGFIALFGIATDDGVLMATYIKQKLAVSKPKSRAELKRAVINSAERRIRPALMTTATTLLALIPVITSTGRGADIMVPMAIPSFGGMLIAMLTVFVVPVLYYSLVERSLDTEE